MHLHYLLMCLFTVAWIPGFASGGVLTINTEFAAATSVLTDGRGTGYKGLEPDTADGWTFYTQGSLVNPDLVVPFGSGSKTLGQQEIRVAPGSELEPNAFFLGFEVTNFAIALRSQAFTDVVAGSTAEISFTGTDLTSARTFFSSDGGSSWSPVANGVGFTTPSTSLEFVFVGNDGIDTTARIHTVAITYNSSAAAAVPEPGTLTLLLTGSMSLAAPRFRRRMARAR